MALAMMAVLRDGPQVVPTTLRKPFWLYPNLLSLDAPLVAVAWLSIFAKTWRVNVLSWQAYLTLALVVWIIYAADRLLDASMEFGHSVKTKARHEFHRKYQAAFRIALVVASLTALVLIVTGLSLAIYSYAVIGVILVAIFFALSFYSTHGPEDIPYAKNIVAGAAFAYGCAILAISETGYDWMELVFSAELSCFAILCILNISAIDLWEHGDRSADIEVKASDELALTLPLILLAGSALFFAWRDSEAVMRPFFYAILTGAGLLHILNRNRTRFSMDALRVLADVALLIPVLVFNAFSQP
jgi:uncharacterized membrane protein YphA (DoxX/SURF4 family)